MNDITKLMVRTAYDALDEKLGQDIEIIDIRSRRIEGNKNSTWILMDYGDVVIHVFSKEDRAFYDLERIWRDGVTMARDDF